MSKTLRLKPRHALPIFSRHPWVYVTALSRDTDGSDLKVGEEVIVATDHGKPIARGLANRESMIRVRLYSWEPEQPISDDLWSERITRAVALRRRLLGEDCLFNGCRLVFSEADGLSGLTVDAYEHHLLVQLTSAALATRQEQILDALEAATDCKGIWLRTEKGIRQREGLEEVDRLARGSEPPRPMFVTETASAGKTLKFAADVIEGQKTGFYFDQRDNRAAVASYCDGRRVLDCHCYTGGFSLTAAAAGAESVLGVDTSEPALTLARGNAEVNGLADRVTFEKADARERLERAAEAGETFDVVILDPPKLARTRGGLQRAMKAYQKLNEAALRVLSPGGILATCSCSGLVHGAEFDDMLRRASLEAGRGLQLLESRHAASDHPTSIYCPETDYLKCRICAAA